MHIDSSMEYGAASMNDARKGRDMHEIANGNVFP
jgi:hypothetical protein